VAPGGRGRGMWRGIEGVCTGRGVKIRGLLKEKQGNPTGIQMKFRSESSTGSTIFKGEGDRDWFPGKEVYKTEKVTPRTNRHAKGT